jgi:glycine cleavage system H protein
VVEAGGLLGEVESTKSVSELYAPVAGQVVAVNTALTDAPETLNADPYGEGWICEIEPSDASAADALLDADGYRQLTAG